MHLAIREGIGMIHSALARMAPTSGVRYAVTGLAATGLAIAAAVALAGGARAADPLQVQVGTGEGQIQAQTYLPGKFSVVVGDSVTFTVGSDEPHSVTFGVGPEDVAPDAWPVTGWATPAPVPPPTPVELGDALVDGTAFVHTGLLWRGSTATATFTSPGTYIFNCVIHPGMSGEVDVLAAGSTGTTQAEADAAAAASADALLSQTESVRAARLADVEVLENSDGTKTWNIFADAYTVPTDMPGGGTGYLELYEMLPPGLEIGVGDTVHWQAAGAHTVTFPATGQDPTTIDPFGPAEGSSSYDGTSFYTSGLLNAGPGAPSSYTLTFPDAGTFEYICALHQFLGQRGVIAVGQPLPSAGAEAPPAASASPAS
jgi:plastocyanin